MPSLYRRTQLGRELLIVLGFALAFMVATVTLWRPGVRSDDLRIVMAASALLLACTGIVFSSLTVEVTDEEVSWRFTALVRKRVPLAEIVAATPVRTTLLDGLGIHWTRGGWLYNVSGRGAVELRLRSGRRVRIGSGEPEALAAAIERARSAQR